MSGARLHTLLPELTSRQPVMVVGAAVIDVIADAYALPWRGCGLVYNKFHRQIFPVLQEIQYRY